MLLAPLLLALNVQTFDRDPGWSNGPIEGLRQVWIDPATVATAVRPLAAAPGPEFERVENGSPTRSTPGPTSWSTTCGSAS